MTDHTSWGATEIEKGFGFHKASVEGRTASTQIHTELRVNFRDFLEFLDRNIPAGRAKSVVRTKMQEASFWAHWGLYENDPIVEEPMPDYGPAEPSLVTDAKIDRYEDEEEPLIREAEWEAANPEHRRD